MTMRRRTLACVGVVAVLAAACGGGDATGVDIPSGATLGVSISGLVALDAATEGRYEAWLLDRSGAAVSLGVLDPARGGDFTFTVPNADPAAFQVTFEAHDDTDAAPSPHVLLRGAFRGARAELSVAGALTAGGAPLKERPGQFTMFSPSDNAVHGYPSFEESGIWLFNMAPRDTPQGDMWVRLTQLQPGWVYEGWMVRDIDTPGAVWLSYGKFRPDASGAVNGRDDTGWGPFSGVVDYLTAGEEEFPGDDWISNPLGMPMPGGLTLPLNLREKTPQGALRWTHVITVEPASDRGEGVGEERPFAVRPYRDVFGDGGPGVPRAITYRADHVPRGEARRR
jgi:hypothetical protein